MTGPSVAARRRDGRARRARHREAAPDARPLRARRAIAYIDLASDEAVDRIHAQNDRLLEEIGTEYRGDGRASNDAVARGKAARPDAWH